MSQKQPSRLLPFYSMLPKIDCWKKVMDDSELLAAVATSTLEDVASMAKLRKRWNRDEITVAAILVTAREKADGKLTNAKTLVSDASGVQQATSTAIAKHKANRFVGSANIVDMCCGIGSDLLALPSGAIGIDNDPLRCWMAQVNTGKEVRCSDASTVSLHSDSVVHIDPSRRNSAGRVFDLEAMLPSFSEVVQIIAPASGGCIKLSPAINPEDLQSLTHPFEIEYIEENNRLVQGAVWFGSLQGNEGCVTATSLKLGASYTGFTERPSFSTEIKSWVLEPNVALERAGLHGTLGNQFGAVELAPGIGLLSTDQNPDSPWFTAFEVLAVTSLRLEKVAAQLRDFGCTQVEVKTRGKTLDPNLWQKKLNKKAQGPLLTIFALRLGKKRVALITRRYVKL
jgi:hypothetical protein